jgi:cysteinyl-tRNA synthetase
MKLELVVKIMSLEVYNSLSKTKEEFIPITPGVVKMYVCGMTVYSDTHIGHARTYLAFDVIKRYFEYKGFKVTYVQNVTDVDDKIINAANRDGVDPLEYSNLFTERCLGDLDNLGIKRADFYPKASETIDDMISMIQIIIEKGYGYVADGDVYFSVEKFDGYGKLSGQNIDELLSGARIEPGDKKHSPLDFALWKKAKPDEPFWNSPWGQGRPGWHIECSTMSSKHLGLPFDIHGGGMDLRFPHHENEIAQAEAASGKIFANYWLHIGLLTVNGEKMSKSIGNIINVKDILKKQDAEAIRFFFAQAHYRSPPDFSDTALMNAKKGLDRIHRFKEHLEKLSENANDSVDVSSLNSLDKDFYNIINEFKTSFEKAMDDDFNTPLTVASIFEFVNNSNKHFEQNINPDSSVCKYALDILTNLGYIITLFQDESKEEISLEQNNELKNLMKKYNPNLKTEEIKTEELINTLLNIRQQARIEKKWAVADSIRDELLNLGFEIQDTSEGPVWRKK